MSSSSEVWPRGVPRVGQRASRSRAVARRDIERFTEISGDRNPLHYDDALAKASKFGEVIVQGGVTSAILNAVVAEDRPGPGTVFLQVNWTFKAPGRESSRVYVSVRERETAQKRVAGEATQGGRSQRGDFQ